LAERHVEIPEQVVAVDDELFVKIIDIDLERRRISLSLKQANEGTEVEIEAFDPTQYGMAARYDAEGNFIYPEGFDPETQEWKPGHESQREEWERQYQEAQVRFLAHKKQKAEAKAADAAGATAETPAEGSAE
jgi:small subunit ribosomal protein S1